MNETKHLPVVVFINCYILSGLNLGVLEWFKILFWGYFKSFLKFPDMKTKISHPNVTQLCLPRCKTLFRNFSKIVFVYILINSKSAHIQLYLTYLDIFNVK